MKGNVGVFCCFYSLNECFNVVVDVNHVLHMQRAIICVAKFCVVSYKNFKISTPIYLGIV